MLEGLDKCRIVQTEHPKFSDLEKYHTNHVQETVEDSSIADLLVEGLKRFTVVVTDLGAKVACQPNQQPGPNELQDRLSAVTDL